ncbi:MFS transporter [Microlunatus aurantiacus]|uniref:MFS transporter n=1 Tax=Microlunatus aurantiacus TaxID=446786 RepID=A0ABP7D3L9_9ACTN
MSTLRITRTESVDVSARSWRNAMFVVFAACGFALAAWVSRTPAVRDGLGASTGHMGWLIFAIAGGAIFGLVSAGALIGRFGARPVIRIALLTAAVGLVVVAAGAAVASSPVVFAGLIVFGLGFGTCDVSMNVAGAANERGLGRTVMPIFHAMYSIGTLTGAALGVLATFLGIPVSVHLGVAAVILVLAVVPAVRLIPEGVGRSSATQPKLTTAERLAVWKDPRTLLIGLMVLGMGFAEGAAEDWLPLATVDGYGVSETVGAALFGIFVVTMTVGRLFGVLLIDRFGRVTTLRASALVAAVGLIITIFGPSAVTAAVGIALWGLGTSLGLPVGMSAAADDARTASARVSAAATVGYAAFLFGPPALAMLGEQVGLLHSFVAVLALVVLAGLIAPAARPLAVPSRASSGPTPTQPARVQPERVPITH